MATGGLGGVHRGWPTPPDVSADLGVLAQTPALVVSSGVKSLLDVPATAELLETLGVPVLGWRTDDAAALLRRARRPAGLGARRVGGGGRADRRGALGAAAAAGSSLGRPPDESLDDVEPLIEQALAAAAAEGVHGQAVTPFVLAYLHRESGGRTLRGEPRPDRRQRAARRRDRGVPRNQVVRTWFAFHQVAS